MSKLKEIADTVRETAGFDVYTHGYGRGDLNDWHDDDGDSTNSTRASHNLRNPSKNPGVSDLERNIYHASGGHYNNIENPFESMAYGAFPTPVNETRQRIKTEIVPRWHRLGSKEKETPHTEIVTFYDGFPPPLSEVVRTDDVSPAHFIGMAIRANLKDSVGRPGSNFPTLNIVGNEELAEEIVKYLAEHPEEYNSLIRGILSKEEYPNVNRGILDVVEPGEGLMILNSDDVDVREENSDFFGQLEQRVFDQHGTLVGV